MLSSRICLWHYSGYLVKWLSTPKKKDDTDLLSYATRLKDHFRIMRPITTRLSDKTAQIQKDLLTCSFVFFSIKYRNETFAIILWQCFESPGTQAQILHPGSQRYLELSVHWQVESAYFDPLNANPPDYPQSLHPNHPFTASLPTDNVHPSNTPA